MEQQAIAGERARPSRGLAVAAGIAAVLLGLWAATVLDVLAKEDIDRGLKRAVAAFAVARTANAVLSAVQEVTVAVQPGGVGMTLAPGQILDPVNDAIEQFSTVMLAVCASFVAQRMLLGLGAHWLMACLIVAAALAIAWAHWQRRRAPRLLWNAALLLVTLRLFVPVTAVSSELIFDQLLSREHAAASKDFEVQAAEAAQGAVADAGSKKGWVERVRDWWSKESNVQAGLDKLKQSGERLMDQVVTLLAVFLLQTVLVPLLILWLAIHAGRRVSESLTTAMHAR